MTIQKAMKQDITAVAALAARMWEHSPEELGKDFDQLLSNREAALFIAKDGEKVIGFAQCQLRHDYVEGTESTPVGYLEGVFVDEAFRRRGIAARRLLSACEAWAKEKGCREFASDCELDNSDCLGFHLSLGFAEANRIICFTKKL